MTRPGTPRVGYPGGRKALWGAGGFLAGYLLTYLWVASDLRSALESVVVGGDYTDPLTLAAVFDRVSIAAADAPGSPTEFGGAVDPLAVANAFFYSAHLVTSKVVLPSGFRTSISPVVNAGLPYGLLLAVPPICLGLAGFAATRDVSEPFDFRFDLGSHTAQRYAWNGGLTALCGYFPLAMVGLFAVTGSFEPNLVAGWLLAAVVYPLAFGGVGGLLAYRTNDEYETWDADARYEQARRTD